MPASVIKSFAEKTNKSEEEVEKLWQEAKSLAKKSDAKDTYAYAVGILKKMLKINEANSFREFLIMKETEHVEV